MELNGMRFMKIRRSDMDAKTILETKEVLNVKDIEVIFACGQSLAYKILREIKANSDRIKLSGRVHVKDYFDYINRERR